VDMAKLGTLIHGTLPDDYKSFLKRENGGRPKPNEFRFVKKDGSTEDGMIYYFFALYPGRAGSLRRSFERYKDRIPAGFLPIGIDPFGNLILLTVAGQNRGSIYFWDHENEGKVPTLANMFLIGNSFTGFIEHMV